MRAITETPLSPCPWECAATDAKKDALDVPHLPPVFGGTCVALPCLLSQVSLY